MNLGQGIRSIRKERSMRQDVLASKAGISQTFLSQIENGKKTPSVDVLLKMAKTFDLPLTIMMWRMMEIEDVSVDKIEAFKMLKPSMDALINSMFPA